MGRTTYYDSLPGFVADYNSMDRNSGRQINWDAVGGEYSSTAFYVTSNGGAAQGATSMTVDALPGAVKAGTILRFGVSEFAYVDTDAAAGATSLSVEALVNAVEDNDTALVQGNGAKSIPAGTIMAELSSGKLIPRASVTGSETSTCLLLTTASEKDGIESGNPAYGCVVGGVIYQNLLPDYSNANFATWKGELDNPSVGTGWTWETYADDSGS